MCKLICHNTIMQVYGAWIRILCFMSKSLWYLWRPVLLAHDKPLGVPTFMRPSSVLPFAVTRPQCINGTTSLQAKILPILHTPDYTNNFIVLGCVLECTMASGFPTQMASDVEGLIMSWRHHDIVCTSTSCLPQYDTNYHYQPSEWQKTMRKYFFLFCRTIKHMTV